MNDFNPSAVPPAADFETDDPAAALTEMNAKYAIIVPGGRTLIGRPDHYDPSLDRKYLQVMRVGDFKLALANRKIVIRSGNRTVEVPLANWWLGHPGRRQHLGGVVCEPDRDPGPDYLNLWQGFAVAPCDGDPGPILDHVRFIASGAGAEAEEYLLNWTALALQCPGSPGEVAVVMRGTKGVGKGVYGTMMLRLFGVHGFYASHQRDLAGNFNAHLLNTCLVFADECFFAGDRQHESTLKAVITERWLRIELKGVDMFQAPNRVTLIMASNKEWVVPATAGERRYFVLDVPDTHKSDRAHWRQLHAAINDKRRLGAFLKHMLERDLKNFEVRDVPRTAALDDQKAASFTTEEKWLVDFLDRGSGVDVNGSQQVVLPWQDDIPTESLVFVYELYCYAHTTARYAMNRVQFGRFLSKYYTRVRLSSPDHPDRPHGYRFGPLDKARARFCEVQDITIKWDGRSSDAPADRAKSAGRGGAQIHLWPAKGT